MTSFTGGCLCGNVRLVATGQPYRVGICHCLDCRKHHGALFHASAVFPQAAVKIEGETGDYHGRHFCPRCGSPVFSRSGDEVNVLDRAVRMYRHGLSLAVLGSFEDHEGFDGVMLGQAGASFHFEFTCSRRHPVAPSPTPEDLLVFYVPEPAAWEARCRQMADAGFAEVAPFNPYWSRLGRSYEDADGYRVVIQQAAWTPVPR